MSRARLPACDWLASPATRAVMAALEAAWPGGARFVGGCVRNTLMGRPVEDIDIATQLTPDQVLDALKAAGLRAIPTGIEHGTVTAISEGEPYEITTLRRDVETDGRRAVVAFSEDWSEDAMRRDFRLNALYAGPDGRIYDPTGGGIEDAKAGCVIFIGDADERLREDYLRILRFFRFNAWYGAEIDEAGLAACTRQKAGLAKIARERIWKELKRLLEAPDPREAVAAMAGASILGALGFAEPVSLERLEGLVAVEQGALAPHAPPDPMRRLMALIGDAPGRVSAFVAGTRLSNSEVGRLRAWASRPETPKAADDPASARQRLYRLGETVYRDAALLEAAKAPERAAEWTHVLGALDGWQRPDLPVRGDDLTARGLKGPEVGEAMRALEAAWVESDFSLGRDELLAKLAKT